MELKVIPVDKEFSVEICDDSGVEFDLNDIFSLHPAARQESSETSDSEKSAANRELSFTTPHKTSKISRSGCLKSPFSLTPKGERQESPRPSPQSSTPKTISGEVSIEKSFETRTPSFHSPIVIPENSIDSNGYSRSARMTSDTLLTWRTYMETPALNLSDSSAQKPKSLSLGEFSTPPRPPIRGSQKATKKLFVSPHETRRELPARILSGFDDTPQAPTHNDSLRQNPANEGDNLRLERSESSSSKDFSLFSQLDDSAKETNSLNLDHKTDQPSLIEKPSEAADQEQPVVEAPKFVDEKVDSFDSLPYPENLELPSLPKNTSVNEESIERPTKEKLLSTESQADETDSREANSLQVPCNSQSEENSLAPVERRNFQYPTATQNHTQLQLDYQKDFDSLGFSQWPNEVYEHANAVVSNIGKTVSNNRDCNELGSKDDLIEGNQDSMAFSQWPSDIYENLDKAIADLENKENVNTANGRQENQEESEKNEAQVPKMGDSKESKNQMSLRNEFEGFTTASNKSIPKTLGKTSESIKNENGLSNSVKKAASFFGEDFSDLEASKMPSFSKASHSVKMPPRPKDPSSFFGEDFSDLDKVDLDNAGFKFASKVLDTADTGSCDNSKPTFGGFSTASGKNVKVSENSLNLIRSSQFNPRGKTGGKQVSFSDMPNTKTDTTKQTTIEETENLQSGLDLLPSPVSKRPVTQAGFSTASGKSVKVSDEALNHIRSSQVPVQQSRTGFSTARGVPVDIAEESPAAVRCSQATARAGISTGFSTAGGAPVKLKEDTLDFIRSSQVPKPSGVSTNFGPQIQKPFESGISTGFSTAGGAPVSFKEDTLDFIRSSQVPKPSGVATGFATASGKGVSVSKQSVDQIRSSQIRKPSEVGISTGFSTAGGAPVSVKEDTLDFIRSSQAPKPSGVSTGFATASGKGVSVSKDSVDQIKSSQAVPPGFSNKTSSLPPSETPSSEPKAPTTTRSGRHGTPAPITPIFKSGSRSSLSLAQNSKRARNADQSKSEEPHTQSDKVRRRESSGSDNSVISRIRRESADDASSPVQYLSKRRRLSRRSGFNSPVTDKTRSCAVVSSPVSHRIRPGLSPLLSSPNLESTIEETPTETSFVTPYNKASSTAQPAPKKAAQTSMLWKQTNPTLPSTSKLIKPGSHSRHPILSLPPPRFYESEELFELGVSCGVEEVTAQNAEEFRFTKPDYFLEDDEDEVTLPGCGVVLKLKEGKSAGHSEFHQALLKAPKIKKQFVSAEWVANHYRLIVWKCAGLERTQPTVYAGCSLTPENVMSQLLLRYSVEVEEGRRSAIRRITEKDDTPAKPMTLVVSGIDSKTIEVSDGWYCLDCVLDNPLSVLIQSRAIKIGSKIVSFSSSIMGTHNDGIPPLQAKSTLKLKLNYNCVRPAAWHASLGYTEVNTLPSLPLSVLAPDGGTCACIEAVLIRRYPVQFLETLDSGKKVFRSEREERKRQEEYDRTRDKIVEDITHKLSTKGQTKRKKSISKEAIKGLDSGKELYDLMKDHPDPSSLQSLLSASQRDMLADYTEKERSRQEVQHNKELLEELNERCPPRKVISLVKHKILCALQPNSKPYFLTTWRAEHQAPLKEGRCYKMYNVSCSSYRGSGLSLSSSKSSMFREMKEDYSHLSAKPVCTVSSIPAGCSECDVIGKVLQTDRQTDTRTVLVMADAKAACEVIVYNSGSEIKVGSVLCIVNLQVSKAGSLICNEKSTMSGSPKDKTLSEKLSEFRKLIADKPESFWENVQSSRSSKDAPESDNWDEVPDIPFEQFEVNTNKQTDKRANDKEGTGVPLFSNMGSGMEAEDLLGCSERAKSDYQTPVKPPCYDSIFDMG